MKKATKRFIKLVFLISFVMTALTSIAYADAIDFGGIDIFTRISET